MRRIAGLAVTAALLGLAGCAPVYIAEGTPSTRETRAGAPSVDEDRSADGPRGPSSERWYPPPPGEEVGSRESLSGVLGSLIWPLAADGATLLTSGYGHRPHPSDGVIRFHRGVDLRAPGGAPVYAAADGRVVQSGSAGAYGWMVEIDHGAGLRSLYAHHRRNLVREGERVRRGQVIGLVGATGNATGEHLHFELRWRDGTVDPRTVLPPLSRLSAR